MVEKKFKQVCHCKNCGNESEMQKVESKSASKAIKQKTKGNAVCIICGNEAEIWLDI